LLVLGLALWSSACRGEAVGVVASVQLWGAPTASILLGPFLSSALPPPVEQGERLHSSDLRADRQHRSWCVLLSDVEPREQPGVLGRAVHTGEGGQGGVAHWQPSGHQRAFRKVGAATGYLPQRYKSRDPKGHVHPDVHSSNVHNSQTVERAKMSIDR